MEKMVVKAVALAVISLSTLPRATAFTVTPLHHPQSPPPWGLSNQPPRTHQGPLPLLSMQLMDSAATRTLRRSRRNMPSVAPDSLHSLIPELETDDGIPVSTLTEGSRPDWIFELLSTFNSRVLERIYDRMGLTIAWAMYITVIFWWAETQAPEDLALFMSFTIPGWPHELVGGFLSILLVFRTDQAYERFWEGRRLWAKVITETRALARITLCNLDGIVEDVCMAHIAAFPIALKQHLRGQKNPAEIAAVVNTFLPPNSTVISSITNSNNMPTTTLLSFSQAAAPLRSAPRYTNLEPVWEQIECHIRTLTEVVSQCEKIKTTPLPLSYSRHTSRFFSMFTLTLPFALVKDTSPVLVPPIVAFVAWILFVTDEIGHAIEDPFGKGLVTDPDEVAESALSEKLMRELFDKMDVKQAGEIGFEELARALKEDAGAGNMNEDKVREIFESLDLNGDGTIDYEEFRQSWTLTLGGSRREIKQLETLPLGQYCDTIQCELLYHTRIKDNLWNEAETAASSLSQPYGATAKVPIDVQIARRLFDDFDANGDGTLSPGEVERALEDRGVSSEKSDVMFTQMDTNSDGIIDWAEFRAAYGVSDMMRWLVDVGHADLQGTFKDNKITGEIVLTLTEEDLINMGVEPNEKRHSLMNQVESLRKIAGSYGGRIKGRASAKATRDMKKGRRRFRDRVKGWLRSNEGKGG